MAVNTSTSTQARARAAEQRLDALALLSSSALSDAEARARARALEVKVLEAWSMTAQAAQVVRSPVSGEVAEFQARAGDGARPGRRNGDPDRDARRYRGADHSHRNRTRRTAHPSTASGEMEWARRQLRTNPAP